MDETAAESTAMIAETVWADDLALYLHNPNPDDLIENLQVACAQLFNTCMKYGLTPNYSKGKSELLVALRGQEQSNPEEDGLQKLEGCSQYRDVPRRVVKCAWSRFTVTLEDKSIQELQQKQRPKPVQAK